MNTIQRLIAVTVVALTIVLVGGTTATIHAQQLTWTPEQRQALQAAIAAAEAENVPDCKLGRAQVMVNRPPTGYSFIAPKGAPVNMHFRTPGQEGTKTVRCVMPYGVPSHAPYPGTAGLPYDDPSGNPFDPLGWTIPTPSDWLSSLKGDKGDRGPRGFRGEPGKDFTPELSSNPCAGSLLRNGVCIVVTGFVVYEVGPKIVELFHHKEKVKTVVATGRHDAPILALDFTKGQRSIGFMTPPIHWGGRR